MKIKSHEVLKAASPQNVIAFLNKSTNYKNFTVFKSSNGLQTVSKLISSLSISFTRDVESHFRRNGSKFHSSSGEDTLCGSPVVKKTNTQGQKCKLEAIRKLQESIMGNPATTGVFR